MNVFRTLEIKRPYVAGCISIRPLEDLFSGIVQLGDNRKYVCVSAYLPTFYFI